jgi:hypothetical protein
MPFKKFILITSLLLLSWTANNLQAQILNTDQTATLDSSKKIQTKIAVSISTDQQKKSLVDLFYSGDFTLIGNKNATTLYTKIDRVTNGGQSIQDVGTFQLKNNRHLFSKMYLETFVQQQWDGGLGLESRTLIGMNLVHYFKNTSTEDIFLGAGLFQEKEKWNWSAVNDDTQANNPSITNNTPKLNITAKYSVINPTNNFEFIVRAFNQTGKYQNIWGNRTSVFSTIQLPISKKINTSFNIDFIYDTNPIVPIGNFHYNYYQTMSYSF